MKGWGAYGIAAMIVLCACCSAAAAAPAALTVASVQRPVTHEIEANLQGMIRHIRAAAQDGARLVLFPETALSGFDQADIENLEWDALEAAMARVAEAAKEAGCYVLYGCATPSGQEKPFNSAVLIDPEGHERMRYHKMYPEPWFTPGDHLAFFDIDGIPCTCIVCHDSRFPELVRLPVLAGAQICFYLSYEVNSLPGAMRKLENYRAQSIARAAENGIWYVQSNGVGPADRPESLSLGNSVIVDPGGVVVAQAPALKEHRMLATLRPAEARRGNAVESLRNPLMAGWLKAGMQRVRQEAPAPSAPERTSAKLALMQSLPVKWDLDQNFKVFLRLLDQAEEADIFITPECWLDGYAAPDKASTPEKLRAIAQDPATSPYLKRVGEEAQRRGMHICFGFSSLEDGKIYNAAGLWNSEGELIGIYHKTHLQTHDLQYSPGMDLPVFASPWGPLGIMICADRRWPETARTLRLKGAKLILNPTYGMDHVKNTWWMRTRGYENQAFIAFAHPKIGFVVNPEGDLEAHRKNKPGVLICEIDLSEAKDDNHIRDRRPDLYQIIAQ